MIDFNKLTLQAQNAVISSQDVMKRFQNSQIEPIHLLFSALEDNTTVLFDILKELKINPEILKDKVEKELNNLPKLSYQQNEGQLYISNNLPIAILKNVCYNKGAKEKQTKQGGTVQWEGRLRKSSKRSTGANAEQVEREKNCSATVLLLSYIDGRLKNLRKQCTEKRSAE